MSTETRKIEVGSTVRFLVSLPYAMGTRRIEVGDTGRVLSLGEYGPEIRLTADSGDGFGVVRVWASQVELAS